MHLVTLGCGRGQYATENIARVTCELCKAKPAYIEAKAEADAKHKAAFEAQVPRKVIEPWQRDVEMTCKACGNDTFRHGDRTCYGHYDNWYCANCGGNESRLTETGMSF